MSTDMVGGLDVARELIPATVRRWLYALGALLGYALTAAAVGFTAAGTDVPDAVTIALAVLGGLMGPLGQLAASNVSTVLALDPDEGLPE